MASNATIKAIESSTVHQIQSGQVIVELCSVAKELVENSIDAGATAIEVRFKNQGLDSIEVQDNGSGIAPHNYESVALKHYTSKLSSYDDLSTLQTFGFRGEALSSLCALSRFSVVTCTQQEVPRATKLEFETSGKLKNTSVVSGQRGTTVFVEDLFRSLPVRRRELERNIKREWGKVVNLLNQYACVQTGVKFTVSQQPTKGKRMILFSTKGNATTRENIINVFGVKTMNALVPMDLTLELIPTTGPLSKGKSRADGRPTEVRILGHVSRPAHGEGRQTPDRQMFYVNGRPCGLPQFAKVFNEVYRSYNASQSPFIFADIQLDTHLYDVNVSPDKRTILLHDQGQMLDNLRESLIELFETRDVTIPLSQVAMLKQTPLKTAPAGPSQMPTSAQPRSSRSATVESRRESEASSSIGRMRSPKMGENEGSGAESDSEDAIEPEEQDDEALPPAEREQLGKSSNSLRGVPSLARWLRSPGVTERPNTTDSNTPKEKHSAPSEALPLSAKGHGSQEGIPPDEQTAAETDVADEAHRHGVAQVRDLHAPVPSSGDRPKTDSEGTVLTALSDGIPIGRDGPEPPVLAIAPPSQPPASRSGPMGATRTFKRPTQEVATITIGDHTVKSVIGSPAKRPRLGEVSKAAKPTGAGKAGQRGAPLPSFGGRLSQLFAATARPDERRADGIALATESVGKDVDAADEEDDGSLFLPQAEGRGDGSEDDSEAEEPADHGSAPAHSEDPETLSNAESVLESVEPSPSSQGKHAGDDEEYVDEEEKKAQEDKRVEDMIGAAEAAATGGTEEGEKRSQLFVKGRSKRKDMTLNLVQQLKSSASEIQRRMAALASALPQPLAKTPETESADGLEAADAEEKLSLKISKSDFAKMRIVGQFNLGFILAVREAASTESNNTATPPQATDRREDDELFIIDQHASDEKYNFERLQATTTVHSQRLVRPKTLDLTAVEEEIILEHAPALERNGFLVQVDTSGARPVGSRARLLSLPLSRETTFSVADLEELLFLLAESPTTSGGAGASSTAVVPRPSKVRKMLAMRACRSSVMIGRALSRRQMERVVRHMGEMEKPWNCPHGRPTMRHLCGLGAWDGRAWAEEDGFDEEGGGGGGGSRTDWAGWVRAKKGEEPR